MKKLFLLLAIVIAPAVAHAQENPEAARASAEAAEINPEPTDPTEHFNWLGFKTGHLFDYIGKDEYGNHYYRTRGGKIDPTLGFERRWVIYNGYAEASTIPPAWHGWMHHTVDVPPTDETYRAHEWEKPHRPNLTGTPAAYRPSGSTLARGRRPRATGDYKPWTPDR